MGRLTLVSFMAIIFVSCGASASFNYRAYVLDAENYAGTLRARNEKDDLPLDDCKPKPKEKDPCYVFKKAEVMRLKIDHENLQEELKCWQSGRCKN